MSKKIWKELPTHYVLMEMLRKKGAITDAELFEYLNEEYKDVGVKEFYEILMRLEIAGKIRITSMARGKKRIELIA